MMVELTILKDGHYYMNGQYVGKLGHSVGPYGVSTGWFRYCKTTRPLQEIKAVLFGEDAKLIMDGKRVLEYY